MIIIANALLVSITIIVVHKCHNCYTFSDLVFRKACRRLLYLYLAAFQFALMRITAHVLRNSEIS